MLLHRTRKIQPALTAKMANGLTPRSSRGAPRRSSGRWRRLLPVPPAGAPEGTGTATVGLREPRPHAPVSACSWLRELGRSRRGGRGGARPRCGLRGGAGRAEGPSGAVVAIRRPQGKTLGKGVVLLGSLYRRRSGVGALLWHTRLRGELSRASFGAARLVPSPLPVAGERPAVGPWKEQLNQRCAVLRFPEAGGAGGGSAASSLGAGRTGAGGGRRETKDLLRPRPRHGETKRQWKSDLMEGGTFPALRRMGSRRRACGTGLQTRWPPWTCTWWGQGIGNKNKS